MYVVHKFVIDYLRKVGKLIVIDEHRIALGYHLFNEGSINREGFSGARGPEYHRRPEGIDDVYPAFEDAVSVLESHRDVHGIICLHQFPALGEGLVPVVDGFIEGTELPSCGGDRPAEDYSTDAGGYKVTHRIQIWEQIEYSSQQS